MSRKDIASSLQCFLKADPPILNINDNCQVFLVHCDTVCHTNEKSSVEGAETANTGLKVPEFNAAI